MTETEGPVWRREGRSYVCGDFPAWTVDRDGRDFTPKKNGRWIPEGPFGNPLSFRYLQNAKDFVAIRFREEEAE